MKLSVLEYPHKGLRLVAPPITQFDAVLKDTIQAMFHHMYAEEGVGLAATQVGLLLRLFVMDVSLERNQPLCLINPHITHREGESISEEGCISFPGVYAKVTRAYQVTVEYVDETGAPQSMTVTGLAAHCIQHELEHLDGILFIDHLSKLKRALILKKLGKLQERSA